MRSTAYIVPTYHISSFPYQSFHKLYIHILYDIHNIHIYIIYTYIYYITKANAEEEEVYFCTYS